MLLHATYDCNLHWQHCSSTVQQLLNNSLFLIDNQPLEEYENFSQSSAWIALIWLQVASVWANFVFSAPYSEITAFRPATFEGGIHWNRAHHWLMRINLLEYHKQQTPKLILSIAFEWGCKPIAHLWNLLACEGSQLWNLRIFCCVPRELDMLTQGSLEEHPNLCPKTLPSVRMMF